MFRSPPLSRTALLAAALTATAVAPAFADGLPGTSPSFVTSQSFAAFLGPQSLTTSSYIWFLGAARQSNTNDDKDSDDRNTFEDVALAGGLGLGLFLGVSEILGDDGSQHSLQPDAPVVDIQTPPDTTVTPEPISMTLLATGLAGMGGASFMRRRKKVDDV